MGYDISSTSNLRIKRLLRLRDRAYRDAERLFIVEGRHLLDRALMAGLQPMEVYTDGSTVPSSPVLPVSVSPAVLDRVSYRRHSQGVIAVFEQFEHSLEALRPNEPSLVLAAEAIEKPGNLGAMLRTADAVGADAFVAVDSVVDIFNPNVVRASTGAVFTVPVVSCSLESFVAWLADHSISLVGGVPDASSNLWEASYLDGTALIVGAEDVGLSLAAKESLSAVSIPMAGAADSLNASVSLALLAFEAVRQRVAANR